MPKFNVLLSRTIVCSTLVEVEADNQTHATIVAESQNFSDLKWDAEYSDVRTVAVSSIED